MLLKSGKLLNKNVIKLSIMNYFYILNILV
jgi:hypothetical protein